MRVVTCYMKVECQVYSQLTSFESCAERLLLSRGNED
jgi:hypothetical protein